MLFCESLEYGPRERGKRGAAGEGEEMEKISK